MPETKFAGLTLLLGAMLISSHVAASEYCSKEQYQRDRALIENAISAGTIFKGPKGLRESILVQEKMWFGMNYLQQIDFMRSFECSMAGTSGKKLLYMDVRSFATGKLLATWTLGALKPNEESRPSNPGPSEETRPTNPGTSEGMEDENRIGLTGEARKTFITRAIEECNRQSAGINCSCYANAMADSISIKELKEASALDNREVDRRPTIEAANKRCQTN
jgi:hypothetical protein